MTAALHGMDYQEFPASPPFNALFDCVWFLTGRGADYRPQPVVPDGRIELVVHLGDSFNRLGANGSSQPQDAILIAGQLTGPIRLQPGSLIDVVGVRLNPLAAHALLTVPLSDFSDDVISLSAVHRSIALMLEATAALPGSRRQRAEAIMRALARSLSRAVDHGMAAAVHSLASGYTGSIGELARYSGMSARTLERRFQSEVGLGPKTFQQVVRFRRAFRMLSGTEAGRWARIALKAGYYDQAHLIRDFRRFAGASPRRFFREDPALAQAFSAAVKSERSSPFTGNAPHREIDAVGAISSRALDSGDE